MDRLRGLHGITPLEALVFVEVVAGAELDVQFQVAGVRLDAYVYGLRTEALAVGSFACAVQVVQQVDLLLLGGCEVDIVFGRDGVVVFDF